MPNIKVTETDESDTHRIGFLARHMRTEDVREVLTATERDPIEALMFAVGVSTRCFIAISERSPGQWTPIAIFGVARSQTEGHGVCWFLSIDLTFSEAKHILKTTPAWLDVLGKGYTVLHNLLDARNENHFRWCLSAGFTPRGTREVNGHPFIHIIRHV